MTTGHSPRWLPDIYTASSLTTSQYTLVHWTLQCHNIHLIASQYNVTVYVRTTHTQWLTTSQYSSVYNGKPSAVQVSLSWLYLWTGLDRPGQIPTLNSNHLHCHCRSNIPQINIFLLVRTIAFHMTCNGMSRLSSGCNGLVYWCTLTFKTLVRTIAVQMACNGMSRLSSGAVKVVISGTAGSLSNCSIDIYW